jgi:hypothetical protein
MVCPMKKDALEKQKNRNAVFDLAQGLAIILILGISLGALYEATYPIFSKIIFFSVIFLLVLILNELMRIGGIGMKSLDALALIFMQLNLMGKKQGIKQDQASKHIEEIENATAKQMQFYRKLTGDLELWWVIGYLILIATIAFVTTILI